MKFTVRNYRCFDEASPLEFDLLPGVTAVLGPNNVGKSAALRFLYDFRALWSSIRSADGLASALAGQDVGAYNWPNEVRTVEKIAHDRNDRPISICVDVESEIPEGSRGTEATALTITIPRVGRAMQVELHSLSCRTSSHQRRFAKDRTRGRKAAPRDPLPADTLLRALDRCARVCYIGPLRHALFSSGATRTHDIVVGSDLLHVWNDLISGSSKTVLDETTRQLAQIGQLFGFDRFEVRYSSDARTLLVVINGHSYELGDVGAGLAQFLVVLANMMQRPAPSWVLVDEPETGLHPRLQTAFIERLSRWAEFGVVFTTHSIALARSANRALVLGRSVNGRLTLEPLHAPSSFGVLAGEFGLCQYDDASLDRILLVEGSTDVTLFRDLVARWGGSSRVGVFSLGGSDLIKSGSVQHLVEFKRISARVLVIIDSEKDTASAPLGAVRKAFKAECKRVGIVCHVLKRRATENYFTQAAVTEALGSGFKALAPFYRWGNGDNRWSKGDNARIARKMSDAEWAATDVGRALKKFIAR